VSRSLLRIIDLSAMVIVVPSPLVGEGCSAGRRELIRVRGLPPQADRSQLISWSQTPHPSGRASASGAALSHKGRK